MQSKSTQTLDTNGNITDSAVYDYGNLSTPVKTYHYTYLTGANYAMRHIMNRVSQVTVTVGGTTTPLVDNWYDTPRFGFSCNLGGMVPRAGALLHDDVNYGTEMVYRGNVYWKSSVGGVQCFRYETTGVMVSAMDDGGLSMTTTPASETAYSLPGVLTPGGNANLATTVTYANSWAVTSLTGPNGANGTTTYDSYGRPEKTKIPDGAETTYTYAYPAMANQQTATLGTGTAARWKRTTQDGFGRVTRVESGNGAATNPAVSQVDTQYAPCACSPLGKMWRVSMPYAPGGTPVWTTYTYDGSGRTLTVTAPDGSVTRTEYLTVYGGYTGNLVKVTDAAGKWKIQQTDALGQLVRVIEPNPSGGADWITNYTYDARGHLTGVSMPRSNGTQTRTFVYTGNDLTSATNAENGTVTYQYDGSHRVTKRTDAKGQETRYTYDAYGRLTQVQHWAVSWDPFINNYRFQEQVQQRVDYSYDSNPLNGSYSQNAWGRLTAVQFRDANLGTPFSYMYSYNQAGRVTAQRMNIDAGEQNPSGFDAAYSWDNEGRMTGINYGPQYAFTYDANGRLGSMQDVAAGNTTVASASYGVAGELTALSYGAYNPWSYSETRQYNAMLQLTRMTGTGTPYGSPAAAVLDMQYIYTGGANNGRIAQSIDGVAGETLNYGYDALNRLSGVSGAWSQTYSYDGFGNLTAKTAVGTYAAWSASFDPATNRQYGLSYDANGNVGTGTYDVENRVIADSSGQYVYDHAGKRVKRTYAGNTQEYSFYGIGGQKLVTLVCQEGENGLGCPTGPQYNVYFGGRLVKSKGVMVVTDRLGSVRANSNGERMSYYPYGEEKTSTADGREKFGSYTRDNATTDYADQRYYAVGMGRFNTPDPSKGSDASDSGSWNKYLYVGGDPINFNDPRGLARCSVVSVFTSNSSPDDGLTAISIAEVYCSSEGRTLGARTWVTPFDGNWQELNRINEESIGAQLDRAEQVESLDNAIWAAKNALKNKPCRELFSQDFDPSSVLDHLSNGDSGYGRFSWEAMGANGSTAEVRGYQPNKAAALGWTADVVINASGAGGWFDHTQATSAYGDFGSNIFNAKTIIHELGHVFETLFGSDSTRIVNDATSNAISFTNSDRVMTDCFGWKRP